MISVKNVFLSLKINFGLLLIGNGANPDEMTHFAAFHMDLHCL